MSQYLLRFSLILMVILVISCQNRSGSSTYNHPENPPAVKVASNNSFSFITANIGPEPWIENDLQNSVAYHGLGKLGSDYEFPASNFSNPIVLFGEWDWTYWGIPPGAVIGDGSVRDDHDCYGPSLLCYSEGPHSPIEGYNRLHSYFNNHNPNYTPGAALLSLNGFYWYQHYAAEWGASIIGSENGAGTGNFQSHIAFSRGAAVQYKREWLMDWSSWYGSSVRTSREMEMDAGAQGCETCGHSDSLQKRLYYLSYLGGANYLYDEGGSQIFFTDEKVDGVFQLTSAGQIAKEFNQFANAHPRGEPWVPIGVVINKFHGFGLLSPIGTNWEYLTMTAGDHATLNLFNQVLWYAGFNVINPTDEGQDIVATRFGFGDVSDVLTEEASEDVLAKYKIIILSGDIDTSPAFVKKIDDYLSRGGKVILNSNLVDLKLRLSSAGTILLSHDPAEMIANISQLYNPLAPFQVSGLVSYQINTLPTGEWLLSIYNNAGVAKPIGSAIPETTDSSFDQNVDVKLSQGNLESFEVLRGPGANQNSTKSFRTVVKAGDVSVFKIVVAN